MCLVLDEFYNELNVRLCVEYYQVVAVSSLSGFGFDKLEDAISKAKTEYKEYFLYE